MKGSGNVDLSEQKIQGVISVGLKLGELCHVTDNKGSALRELAWQQD